MSIYRNMNMNIKVIYEDADILVCEKPVGMLVQSDRSMDADMVNEIKNYLYEKQVEKKEPYVGLIHRLDRPVGGVLVFAKTSFAAKSLSAQVQGDQPVGKSKKPVPKMNKKYYAVVDADLSQQLGKEPRELIDYLVKDARTNTSKVTRADDKNGKKALLLYQVLQVAKDERERPISLVEVELKTGRHHQIRVQMAANKMPLWGDTKYNVDFVESQKQYTNLRWANVGLFSHSLEFSHPKTNKRLYFEAVPIEGVFQAFHFKKNLV